MENFGKHLQAARKTRGLSQEELAEKMGVSRQAIGKWESGASYPETEKLVELGEVLKCSVDSLIKGETAINNNAKDLSDKTTYDKLMNKFSWQISLAIMIILLGSSVLLAMAGFGMPYTDYGLVAFFGICGAECADFCGARN